MTIVSCVLGTEVLVAVFVALLGDRDPALVPNLYDCARGVVAYRESLGAFPPSTPWTPSASPDRVPFEANPSLWSTSPWEEIGFAMTKPHFFRYRIFSGSKSASCQAEGMSRGGLVAFERIISLRPDGVAVMSENREIASRE